MKVKDVITRIVQGREYRNFADFLKEVRSNEQATEEERGCLCELADVIYEMLKQACINFSEKLTRSYQRKDNSISALARKNLDPAIQAFKRQIQIQMPAYMEFLLLQMEAQQQEKEKDLVACT